MREEVEDQGGMGTPDTGATPAEPVVDAGDERYQASVRGMNEAQREAAQLRADNAALREQYEWANHIQERYHDQNDPNFRQGFDTLLGYGQQQQQAQAQYGQAGVPDPETQALKQDVAYLKQEKSIDALVQKYGATKEEVGEVLSHIADPQGRKSVDPEVVFKHLFFDKALEAMRQDGAADAAGKIAKNRGAYPRPPSGQHKPTSKDSMKGKSRNEKLADFDKRFGDSDFTM